jgi:HlyD family secretion protein
MTKKESHFSKKVLFILLALLGASAVSYLFWRGPKVTAVTPTRGAVIQKVVASGQIIPKARIKISSQVSGRVDQVFFQEGDKVDPTKPLMTLAQDEALAQVEAARAGLEQARAKADQSQGVGARIASETLRQAQERLKKARANAKREQELDRAHATTKESLDQALSDVRLAESQVDQAFAQAKASSPQGSDNRMALAAVEQSRAGLAAAEARLSLFTVSAPIASQILARSIEPGDSVQVGSPLFILASLEPLRVKIQVDEKYISLVREGQSSKITADAYPGRPIDAKVERLSPAVNPDRGALEVHLIIPEAPDFLRVDMSASVEIVTNSADDVLLLPVDSLQDAATDQPFVYVADKGHVARKDVSLGLRGDQVIEITGGISPQDHVLIAKEPLKIGTRVRPEWKG